MLSSSHRISDFHILGGKLLVDFGNLAEKIVIIVPGHRSEQVVVLEVIDYLLRFNDSDPVKLLLRLDHSQSLLVHVVEHRVLLGCLSEHLS